MEDIEKGDLISATPIEVVSGDKNIEDVTRMAVIMPMHAVYDKEKDPWPIAWDGWPKEDEVGESDNEGSGGDLDKVSGK